MLSFLDLSDEVRHRIYVLAGLVRVCPINLNLEGGDKTGLLEECEHWFSLIDTPFSFNGQAGLRCYYRRKLFTGHAINPNADGFDCICKPLPTALLLVSRAIHEEVSEILFAENMFRICRSDRHGLSSLFTLSPLALKSMTSLSIRLNACSCVPDHWCLPQCDLDKQCDKCHYNCKAGRDFPISVSQETAQTVISEWKRLVGRLAQCINPYQLRLSVVCDTLDYTTAKQIIQPLLQLPILEECAIRLGQAPDPDLNALAEKTVLRLTCRAANHPNQPFEFLDLPKEIQLQILSYTDLISENGISWTHSDGIEGNGCCRGCTDALEGCCCPVRHAAYTTAYCTCWAMPSAIFLVNRTFYKYAIEIFFSKNTFKVDPGPSFEYFSYILGFLQALPFRALAYIRTLHLIFRELDYSNFETGYWDQYDWNAAVEFTSQKLTLPKLTLIIEDRTDRGESIEHLITGRDDSDEIEELEWRLYQRVAEPLLYLETLRNLYIHFGPPPYEKHIQLRNERETILEKQIMGQAYDSTASGKFAERDLKALEESAVDSVFGPDGTQIWPLL